VRLKRFISFGQVGIHHVLDREANTHAGDTQVLNRRYAMTCSKDGQREAPLSILICISKCSICSFHKRTSEVQLSLLQRVQVGQGLGDEV
jgi:hypothetical protein